VFGVAAAAWRRRDRAASTLVAAMLEVTTLELEVLGGLVAAMLEAFGTATPWATPPRAPPGGTTAAAAIWTALPATCSPGYISRAR
jgi:hypothetical protein